MPLKSIRAGLGVDRPEKCEFEPLRETLDSLALVREHGQPPHDQVMIVVQLSKASNLLFGGTANHLMARVLSKLATDDQKLAMMRCLFEVSATDEAISIAEESKIHLIANELRITRLDLIALRVTHRQHLPGCRARNPFLASNASDSLPNVAAAACRACSYRRKARQPIATLMSLGLGGGVWSMKYTR